MRDDTLHDEATAAQLHFGPSTTLRRGLRTIAWVRLSAVLIAVVQVATFWRDYPRGDLEWAVTGVVALAAGAAMLALPIRLARTPRALRWLGYASLTLDTVMAAAFVAIHTFDPDTTVWVVLYIVPLEGALLFQLRGALVAMGAATVLYTARELYGESAFGFPFLPTSIAFRMGMGFIIAAVAGLMARGMIAERDRVDAARARLQRRTEELRDANERLEEALALQDDFLAITNHELRTPLTAILGYGTTLRRRWRDMDDDNRLKALAQITGQSERLLELVDDVLTASAAQAGKLYVTPRPTALLPVLEAAVEASGVDAQVDCDLGIWVHADARRLGQAVENLLTNARKYGQPPVTVSATDAHGEIIIVVADAGEGVPPSFEPRLFQRFARAIAPDDTDTDLGGNGLGLSIVKGLLEAQDGRVWYEPGQPHGARFCLAIRSATSRATASAPSHWPAPSPKTQPAS